MLEGFPFKEGLDTQEDIKKEDSNSQSRHGSDEMPQINSKLQENQSNLINVGLLGSPPAVDSQEERGDKYLQDKSSKIKL